MTFASRISWFLAGCFVTMMGYGLWEHDESAIAAGIAFGVVAFIAALVLESNL